MNQESKIDYGWLEKQISLVKTKRFFVVDGPCGESLKQEIESSQLRVPTSYKRFVIQFGGARLYRVRDQYLVEVFAEPFHVVCDGGDEMIQFGKTDESPAYFKSSQLQADGREVPVFEWNPEDGLIEVYPGFERWLIESCKIARRQFSAKKWSGIVNGPEPFTHEELSVIEARRKFSWEVMGVGDDGDLIVNIANNSDTILPYLTLGVRGETIGTGAVFVPVDDILPNQSKVVKVDCYKEVESPANVVLFAKPDPEPETRDRYWEFRAPLDSGC